MKRPLLKNLSATLLGLEEDENILEYAAKYFDNLAINAQRNKETENEYASGTGNDQNFVLNEIIKEENKEDDSLSNVKKKR